MCAERLDWYRGNDCSTAGTIAGRSGRPRIDMQGDLNDTLLFVTVVEQGSFTAAARTLGLPKTTVSRRVRGLEEHLGARLLHRTTRRLSLTEAGTVYFERSRHVARDLAEAEAAVHQLQGSPRGWLRVTAPYSLGVVALAPVLREFRDRYPEIRVDVVLDNERLDLVGDSIDVALRIGPLPDSSLVARHLATWPLHVFAGEGYLSRHGEPLVPEDLRDHRVLATARHRRAQGYAWPLEDGTRREDFEVRPVVVANDPQMLLSFLYADQGLMLASEIMLRQGPAGVRRVLGAWSAPDVVLNAVYMGGGLYSPKVRAFVDFLAERMQGDCAFQSCPDAA